MSIALLLFVVSVALAGYCFLGMPALALWNGYIAPEAGKNRTGRNKPGINGTSHAKTVATARDTAAALPPVSICIAAYNEEATIVAKIKNTLSRDYPGEKLEIIVASDGSTDNTVNLVTAMKLPNVIVLDLPRRGKNKTLNTAVTCTSHHLLLFTDADVHLEKNAIKQLITPFADNRVGCVAGDFRYRTTNGGENAHWNLDRWMKKSLSRTGSATSASGQLYAIRKCIFRDIPDGVTDDFYVSCQAHQHRLRLLFADSAVCTGDGVDKTAREYIRKERIFTAGLTGVWHLRSLCNPFNFGFIALQLFTHKVARRIAVIPLLAIFFLSGWLAIESRLFLALFLLQLAFHLLAFTGYVLRQHKLGKLKVFSIPYFIDMVLLASVAALRNLSLQIRRDKWEPQRDDPGSA